MELDFYYSDVMSCLVSLTSFFSAHLSANKKFHNYQARNHFHKKCLRATYKDNACRKFLQRLFDGRVIVVPGRSTSNFHLVCCNANGLSVSYCPDIRHS